MIAQAAHIPVHLGSMPLSVKAAMEAMEEEGGFADGDMVMLNDPFKGGTHLPDITIVAPVFAKGKTGHPFSSPTAPTMRTWAAWPPGPCPYPPPYFRRG